MYVIGTWSNNTFQGKAITGMSAKADNSCYMSLRKPKPIS